MVTYFNQHKLVVITKYKVFIFCWVYNMLTLMLDAWTATCICGLRGIYHVVCKVLEPLDDKYYKRIIYNPYSANSEAIHIIQTIRPKPCTLAH